MVTRLFLVRCLGGLTLLAASGTVVPAHAQPGENRRPLVYVADVTPAVPGLQQDAGALTTALCGAMARDKRVEVMCAPDVRQILEFAALSSLTGGSSPAVEALESRLAAVAFVVSGGLSRKEAKSPGGKDVTGQSAFVLVVAGGPKNPDGDASAPAFDKPTVRLEEVGIGPSTSLLERLPELTTRLLRTLLTPSAGAMAPPEPLK
jgi:hypothetical protein